MNQLDQQKEELKNLSINISFCQDCNLHKTRKRTCAGNGFVNKHSEKIRFLFIGEAPGANEDEQGKVFVGKSGKLIRETLKEVGFIDYYITNTVKCLERTTKVKMANGTTKKIQDLVNKKSSEKVLSLSTVTNALEYQKISGWYKGKLEENQYWMKLSFASAKRNPNGIVGAILTNDHKVYTEEGYKRVDMLSSNDKIAIGEPSLNPIQEKIFYGSILGDGHFAEKNSSLNISHCRNQKEWIQAKASVFNADIQEFKAKNQTGKSHYTFRFTTNSIRDFNRKFRLFKSDNFLYELPKDLSFIDEIVLCVWYLDNGYINIRKNRKPIGEIATHNFRGKETKQLASYLKKIGIDCYHNNTFDRIYLTQHGIWDLSKIIYKYVPSSMQYKLHPDFRDLEFHNIYKNDCNFTFSSFDKPIVKLHNSDSPYLDRSTFCLDIENNHNFATLGGIVKNCRPPENRNPNKQELESCGQFLAEQIDIIKPEAIILIGKVAYNNFKAHYSNLFKENFIHTIWHPSYILRNGGKGSEKKYNKWYSQLESIWQRIK